MSEIGWVFGTISATGSSTRLNRERAQRGEGVAHPIWSADVSFYEAFPRQAPRVGVDGRGSAAQADARGRRSPWWSVDVDILDDLLSVVRACRRHALAAILPELDEPLPAL